MELKRKLVAVAAAGALVLTLGACTSSDPAEQGSQNTEIRYGVNQTLQDWDTRKFTNNVYGSLPYENLVTTEADKAVYVPQLAESWVHSNDSLSLTLREGVEFHDGTAFNADAVVANLLQIKESPNFSGAFSAVSGVEKVGEYEVLVSLSRPYPTLLADLAGRGTKMISPAALADESYLTTAVGTGPYVHDAENSTAGSEEVFVRWDDYYDDSFDGATKVSVVSIPDASARYNALRAGQVNVIELSNDMAERAESDGMTVFTAKPASMHLQFRDQTAGGPFELLEVRQAICHAIDTESIIAAQQAGMGQVANQIVPQGSIGYSDNIEGYDYDPEESRKLLESVGNPNVSFELPVLAGFEVAHQILAENMKEVGIDVELVQMSRGQYFGSTYSQDYPIFYSGNADFATWLEGPYAYASLRFTGTSPANTFKIPSPELDAILSAGLQMEQGSAEQEAQWMKITEWVDETANACAILERDFAFAFDPAEIADIKGQEYSPLEVAYRTVVFPGS